MVVQRGEVWWSELEEPRGSAPGYRRPLLIVQADSFNRSRIETVIAVALASNLHLVEAPGNVLLPKRSTGLSKDSVANVSQVITVDRNVLAQRVGRVPGTIMTAVDHGLRLVLDL